MNRGGKDWNMNKKGTDGSWKEYNTYSNERKNNAAGESDSNNRRRGIKILAGIMLLGLFLALIDTDYFLVPIGVLPVLAIVLIYSLRSKKKYERIRMITKDKDAFLIRDIEEETGMKKKEILRGLKYAIGRKLIPYGCICKNKMVFIQSEYLLKKYLADKEHFEEYYIKQSCEDTEKEAEFRKSDEIMKIGKESIYKIRESNALIDDPGVSEKLEKTEKLVSSIFDEAVKHPEKADNLGMFMNYYLPTTKKILKAYAELEAAGYDSESIRGTKAQIESAIDKINDSFEKILDKMYRKEAASVAGEISALEAMMRQEGLY